MARARRGATVLASGAAVASVLLASTPVDAAATTYATRHAKAVAAIQTFKVNGFASVGLPKRDAVKVRACFRGVCAHERLQPDPVCDGEICIGTALRAVKVTRRLIVSATYAP
jgi:hypothetical protein